MQQMVVKLSISFIFKHDLASYLNRTFTLNMTDIHHCTDICGLWSVQPLTTPGCTVALYYNVKYCAAHGAIHIYIYTHKTI